MSGCNQNGNEAKVLSKVKMSELLKELHLAEEKVNMLAIKKDSQKVIYKYFKDQIFEAHCVREQDFDSSFSYYSFIDNEGFANIYKSIVDSLVVLQKTDGLKK